MKQSPSKAPVGASIGRLHGSSAHHAFLRGSLVNLESINLFALLARRLVAQGCPPAADLQSVDLIALADGSLRLQLRVSAMPAGRLQALCAALGEPAKRIVAQRLNLDADALEVVIRPDLTTSLPPSSPVFGLLSAVQHAALQRKPRVMFKLHQQLLVQGALASSEAPHVGHWIQATDLTPMDHDAYAWRASMSATADIDGLDHLASTLQSATCIAVPSLLEVALAGPRELHALAQMATHPATFGMSLLVGAPLPHVATAVLDLEALRHRQTLLHAGMSAPPLAAAFHLVTATEATAPRFAPGDAIQHGGRPDLVYVVKAFADGLYALTTPVFDPSCDDLWAPQSEVERSFFPDEDDEFGRQMRSLMSAQA